MLDSSIESGVHSILSPTSRAAEMILTAVGEDVSREGLLRTPKRFEKAIKELTSGYQLSLKEAIGEGIFAAEGRGMVSVRDVEFYSMCEHHMLPFWGRATVAYYPSDKILGLSKIPRIVDLFAKRFQVQERITRQIAEAIKESIQPRAVMVRVQAQHLCMMMRGVEKQGSDTVTEFQIGLENLNPFEKERLFQTLTSN
jgi:GTP cyclohydrolase I